MFHKTMEENNRKAKIVVVGGGTGTHTVLRGLKRYANDIDISAIVTMADSGGSSGRLRDEFGQLPAGDVRNALTALAADGDEQDLLLRQLFEYRFDRGTGLSGHNFGNLFLTALTDILGSESKAIAATSRILRIAGRVIPVTLDQADLIAEYSDGTVIKSEHAIDTYVCDRGVRIVSLRLSKSVTINPEAAAALKTADMIVIGPGDLYTSVLANCIVPGFSDVVKAATGRMLYVSNLMSKAGHTIGMNAAEHLSEVTAYIGRQPDAIIVNSSSLPSPILDRYAKEGAHPIENNCIDGQDRVYALPLLSERIYEPVSGDDLVRSLVRHDPDALAKAILTVIKAESLISPLNRISALV
jgi:uncharacterized cofD-like protein